MKKKIVGIIGGMGAEAGCYFYERLIKNTKARNDHDHIETILYTNVHIPDRTQAILYGGESPVEEINKSIKLLEKSGATILVMPCVTAHYFIDEIIYSECSTLLNLLQLASERIFNQKPLIKKIGVIATTGTLKSGLLNPYFEKNGKKLIFLKNTAQEDLVMNAIFGKNGIKNSHDRTDARARILESVRLLRKNGAEAILSSCTEIPLVLNKSDLDIPLFDILEYGAKEIVKMLGKE